MANLPPPQIPYATNNTMSSYGTPAHIDSNTTSYNNMTFNLTDHTPLVDWACLTLNEQIDDPLVHTSHEVFTYSSIWFTIIGLIGNTMSMMVFASTEMRKVSSNVYLFILAISDSVYLISIFFIKVITILRCLHGLEKSIDIVNNNTVFCKLAQFVVDLCSDYSTCLILAFTVERYLACYQAFRYKQICTVIRARLICLFILIIIMTSTLPHHVISMGRFMGFDACIVLPDYEDFFMVCYGLETLLYKVIPVFVIAWLNLLIIRKVCRLHRKRKEQRQNYEMNVMDKQNHARERRNWANEGRHLQITIMLIVVSTTYVISFFPTMAHWVLWKLQRLDIIAVSYEDMIVAQNFTSILYISGFGINFFLYTVSCKAFREQLQHILCPHRGFTEVVINEDTTGLHTRGQNGSISVMRQKNTQTTHLGN